MHRLIAAFGIVSLIVLPAHAESIKEQIIGVWSFIEGGEQFPTARKFPTGMLVR